MARRPDHARRAEIAARAFETIRARGVHRTTMSDIAAALEMKRPTLYWYFRGLEDIFEAVIAENEGRFTAFVAGRLHGIEHPLDYLDALVRAIIDFYEGRRELIIVLFQLWAVSGAEDPESILARNRRLVEPMRDGLVARLRDGIDAGLVADHDPEQLVDMALALADGAQVQRVTRDAELGPIVEGFRQSVLEPLRRGGRERTNARGKS